MAQKVFYRLFKKNKDGIAAIDDEEQFEWLLATQDIGDLKTAIKASRTNPTIGDIAELSVFVSERGARLGPSTLLQKHGSNFRSPLIVVYDPSPKMEVKISSSMGAGSLPSGTVEDIGKAIKAIIEGKYLMVNGTIVLNEVNWPCATNQILYVRDYYVPLLDGVLDHLRRKSLEREHLYVLTGQPGVGKSVFGWYVIFKLLLGEHKDKTILYLHKDLEGKAVIIDPAKDIIQVVHRSEVVVDANNTIQISDTVAPLKLNCPTLWIGSPGSLKKEEVKEMRNRFGPDWLYMPLGSLQELLDMHSKNVFSTESLSSQAVRDRVSLWGPVCRQVVYRHSYSKQEALWESIKNITPQEIEKSFACVKKSEGDGRNPHHSLFLERAYGQDVEGLDLRSPNYYKRGSPIVASAAICNWLINAMEEHKTLQKADFIMWSAGVGEDGAKRGTAFEELSLKVLQQGGEFKVRELGTTQALNWQIDGMRRVAWKQQLSVEANTLIVPRKTNETGFDALMWLPGMSQHVVVDFTVSEKHGIHQEGLANNLGWNGKTWLNVRTKVVPYIWVVPQDRFESWTRPQAAKDGTRHDIGKSLKQYVMEIPYESLLKIFRSTSRGGGKSAEGAVSAALMPEDVLRTIMKSSPDTSTGGFGAGAFGSKRKRGSAPKLVGAEGDEQQSGKIQSGRDGIEEKGSDGGSGRSGRVDRPRR